MPVPEQEHERKQGMVMMTPMDISVYNPSFDVTEAELITAIVSEKGVALKENQASFDLSKIV